MARPKFVKISPKPPHRWRSLLGDRWEGVEEAAERARQRYRGRAIWHVSSTLRGGGVAEMLHSLLPYVRGAGIDTRWVVVRERPEFFALTKRLHNLLHEAGEAGGGLGAAERRLYEETRDDGGGHLRALVRHGDVVFLHDPQTAGLAAVAKRAGATVIWRCHIGVDRPGPRARAAWEFLAPYVADADACVFSRREYVWDLLDPARTRVMAPSLDPFSPKNEELGVATVEAIVDAIGLGAEPNGWAPAFTRADGSPDRVERPATVLQEQPLAPGTPAIVQVSRWDRLKDHRGLLECFAAGLAAKPQMGPGSGSSHGLAHLVLAGPASEAVADDPDGAAVWAEVRAAWEELTGPARSRVHLVSLPMDDVDENAAMVNALQRRADVVVQKSLAEGFGLTVAEAMWKRRPVVGARVGGIQDQIVDGSSGLLVDPTDGAAVCAAIGSLLADPARAAALGEAARERVAERYLGALRLAEYADLLAELEGGR